MKRTFAVTAVALATLVLGATEAQAQTLTACYVKNTGTVYRIKSANAPTKCSNNHVEFSWNAAGQAGPQGEVGPQGPAGTSSFGGIVRRSVEYTMGPNEFIALDVYCNSDEIVTGGGYATYNGGMDLQAITSGPIVLTSPEAESGWMLRGKNTGAIPQLVAVQALCMKLPT